MILHAVKIIVRVYAVSKNDLLKGGFKQDWKVWLGFG